MAVQKKQIWHTFQPIGKLDELKTDAGCQGLSLG
jgi:hypothetical protein